MNIVWRSILDGVYDVRVEKSGEYTGVLRVSQGERLLYTEEVTLAYGALFGPDVADVAGWQEKDARAVDDGLLKIDDS